MLALLSGVTVPCNADAVKLVVGGMGLSEYVDVLVVQQPAVELCVPSDKAIILSLFDQHP